MKRKILYLLLSVSVCLLLASCGGSPSEETVPPTDDFKPQSETNIPESVAPETSLSPTEQIDASLRRIVAEYYTSTDISSITINDDLGTDEDGDYIALVYLTWNVKNKPDTTKDVLAMYSEDFAARIGTDILDVSEFAVFWTVPYYSETDTAVKYSYERVEGGMVQTDSMISNILS